jgi:hypothetical protein
VPFEEQKNIFYNLKRLWLRAKIASVNTTLRRASAISNGFRVPDQGKLAKGDGSVQLTSSLRYLFFEIINTIFNTKDNDLNLLL